jgi:hypothetical protein
MISYTTCAGCSKRIRESADDLCVSRRDGTEPRFYHLACHDAAEDFVSANGMLRVWTITYRPAYEEAA